MRPEQFSSGNRVREDETAPSKPRFNEAGAIQLRKSATAGADLCNGYTRFNEAGAIQLRKSRALRHIGCAVP